MRFVLASLFNGISTFVGYLMPKPFFEKDSSDNLYLLRFFDPRKYVNKIEKRRTRVCTTKQLGLFNYRKRHVSIDQEKKQF